MQSSIQQIAFTICSNNYLGQALALKTSFLKFHPQYRFYIILVDKPFSGIDYASFTPGQVLFIKDIPNLPLDTLLTRYNIIELNTAVKPSIFKHLMGLHPNLNRIYYLDPDLYFFGTLKVSEDLLKSKTAVVTPHIITPIPRDGMAPNENTFLNFGLYNLGFLGINPQHLEAINLLDWWEERTLNFGHIDLRQGYFVDQLWINLVPLFFKEIAIIKDLGYNMAPWNLHERSLQRIGEDGVVLQDDSPLIFYHFSKLSDDPNAISREYNRFTFQDKPLLRTLYNIYKNALEVHSYSMFKEIPIAYTLKPLTGNLIKIPFWKRILKKIGKKMVQLAEKK